MIVNLKTKYDLTLIILFLMLASLFVPLSPMISTATAAGLDGEGIDTEDDDDDEGWISGLIQKIDDLIYKLTHIPENIQQWLEGWLVSLLDSAIEPLVNIWGAYMIETPLIGPVGFVNKLWNLSLFYAIPLFGLALIPTAWRLWTAKNSTGLKQPVLLFLKAVTGCMFTLYIIDFAIALKNKVSTLMAEVWLTNAYERLGQDELPLDAVNGIMMLKAALVSDSANMDTAVSLGSVFYNELGLFWVFIAIPILALISLVMFISWILLTLLGISAPVYFTFAVLLNRMESLAGWINLSTRTIMIPFLFLIAWGISVNVNDPSLAADVGVSPVLVCLIILVISLILSWFIWFKPAYKGVMHPITLNGGEVMERGGEWLAEVSSAAKAIASNMGLNNLALKSERFEEFGERVKDFGTESKRYGEKIRPGNSTVLDKEPLPLPKFLWQSGNGSTNQDGIYVAPTVEAAQQIERFLKKEGLQAKVEGNKVLVNVGQGQQSKVDRIINNIYSENKMYWRDGHEYVTFENGLPVRNPIPPADGIYMGEFKKKR